MKHLGKHDGPWNNHQSTCNPVAAQTTFNYKHPDNHSVSGTYIFTSKEGRENVGKMHTCLQLHKGTVQCFTAKLTEWSLKLYVLIASSFKVFFKSDNMTFYVFLEYTEWSYRVDCRSSCWTAEDVCRRVALEIERLSAYHHHHHHHPPPGCLHLAVASPGRLATTCLRRRTPGAPPSPRYHPPPPSENDFNQIFSRAELPH